MSNPLVRHETMVANSKDVLEVQKMVVQSRDQEKQKNVSKANDVAYKKNKVLYIRIICLNMKVTKCYCMIGKKFQCEFYPWMEKIDHQNILQK